MYPPGCKYSKNMTDPKPQFPESNCVVHEDDVDWGGQEELNSDKEEKLDEDNTS